MSLFEALDPVLRLTMAGLLPGFLLGLSMGGGFWMIRNMVSEPGNKLDLPSPGAILLGLICTAVYFGVWFWAKHDWHQLASGYGPYIEGLGTAASDDIQVYLMLLGALGVAVAHVKHWAPKTLAWLFIGIAVLHIAGSVLDFYVLMAEVVEGRIRIS